MRNRFKQMSLSDIYRNVETDLEQDKPKLFGLLDQHIDWGKIIPSAFYKAFYQRLGRSRRFELESFLRALFLQRVFHYIEDSQLLNTLRFCREMRDFCGFDKVPDASKLTRFKQSFCGHIRSVFERLVDLTEPVCREMDEALADLLVFDSTGIESYVAENNPKFPRTKAGEPFDYSGTAASNPQVKYQFINGHMCYAKRAAVVANGLGIVRRLELLDEDFRRRHPEIPREPRTSSPEIDKEIYDSIALKPVLQDLKSAHPNLHYSAFAGDAAFDKYDNYTFLLKNYGFNKAVIPLNPRNSSNSGNQDFNENGAPLCPSDGTPFLFHSKSGGKRRSLRLKYVCPKTQVLRLESSGMTRRCFCNNPCSESKYGKCVYIYPNKNLRLYPGLSRDSQEFETICNHRTSVERTINTLKHTLGIQGRKTSNELTTKADLFLAGIVQLLCVLLAAKMRDFKLARRPRKLIA